MFLANSKSRPGAGLLVLQNAVEVVAAGVGKPRSPADEPRLRPPAIGENMPSIQRWSMRSRNPTSVLKSGDRLYHPSA